MSELPSRIHTPLPGAAALPDSGMKFTSDDDNTFELHVVRYERPDVTEDVWDSNWLVVTGKVTVGDRTWTFVDPCVTTFELEALCEWLANLGSQRGELTFAEPNLAFAYTPWPAPVVHIRFAAESAPPWVAQDGSHDGATVQFEMPADRAKMLAAELRDALVDFPTRGGAA